MSRKIGKGKTAYVDGTFESQKNISGKSAQKPISMAQLLRQKLVGFQEIFSTFRVAQKDPLDLEVLQAGGLTSRTRCMPICGERLDIDRERGRERERETERERQTDRRTDGQTDRQRENPKTCVSGVAM